MQMQREVVPGIPVQLVPNVLSDVSTQLRPEPSQYPAHEQGDTLVHTSTNKEKLVPIGQLAYSHATRLFFGLTFGRAVMTCAKVIIRIDRACVNNVFAVKRGMSLLQVFVKRVRGKVVHP